MNARTRYTQIKKDSKEIVRRLKARNPGFEPSIKDGTIKLEDFVEIVIIQYRAFLGVK